MDKRRLELLKEFEDRYNPMRINAYLRFGLGIPRTRANELSQWYEDVFYKIALREAGLNIEGPHDEKKESKLESNLHSNSRDSRP